MNLFHALLLGIVEGLTEFVPVSSTAHMLIVQKLFNIPSSDAMFAFLVLVQIGPLVALLIYFWKDLWNLAMAFLTKAPFSTPENKLAWFVVIATIPALLMGLLLKSAAENLFSEPLLAAGIRLLVAAALLFLAEWLGKQVRSLDAMNWLDALIVGIFQVFAVFPGSSRSGSAISGGMLRGMDRASATRFAFLMSAPVMLAAGGYETLGLRHVAGIGSFVLPLVIGFIAAGVVGWFSIRWLIDYVSKHSLYVFAVYCAVVGIAALVVSFLVA